MNNKIDLLASRYEVIADYPYSPYKVSDIIPPDELVVRPLSVVLISIESYVDVFGNNGLSYYHPIEALDKYKHLFKKLKWWECRKDEEMPKYLKRVEQGITQYVYKVEKYKKLDDGWDVSVELQKNIFYPLGSLKPATIEEYEEYQSTLNR